VRSGVQVKMGRTPHDVFLHFPNTNDEHQDGATFQLRWPDDVNADECFRCREWLRSRLRREGLQVADGD
jgi:hypothetical protein